MANAYIYTTLAGDTFDSIALDFYSDETKASTIIQYNLAHRDVLIFNGGERLQIPIIEAQAAAALPPWKRGSA